MFLPDTDKRKKQMKRFNRNKMGIMFEFQDESFRARKRDLKDSYKRCMQLHAHRAKYLPVNPFLEDFYYLKGLNPRNGMPVQQNKKL